MRNNSIIFLDFASTTPVDPRVVEAMLQYFDQMYGNPSSTHQFGQLAEHALEDSRRMVADFIGAKPGEIIFTSCGSESDNLALRGVAFAERDLRGASHILISPVEHHAVSNTAFQLQELLGFEVELLPVDQYGIVDPEDVAKRIRTDTALVSVIHANNEIGSINPIGEIGKICRSRGVRLHTDAVQGAAHLPVNVNDLHVDLMSIGAHKFFQHNRLIWPKPMPVCPDGAANLRRPNGPSSSRRNLPPSDASRPRWFMRSTTTCKPFSA